ncbi:hypothetical protein NKH84_26595 [Mesorhizobium sp. M0902]|uniref:hypothetical protein n=1 Tax=Mesorhizobium sp. M0902 TaxID=2957021 RepID=UPI00333861A2
MLNAHILLPVPTPDLVALKPLRTFGRHVPMPGSRSPLPTRPDRLQQFGLAGVNISKNGHNHHRQDFGVRIQRVKILIRADPIEHAFANSQIVRAQARAIETPTQHLGEPFRARRACFAAGFLLMNR